MNRIFNACTIGMDENNNLKDRTVCKSCYKKKRRKNNNKSLNQNQQQKIDNFNNNNNNNRNHIIGVSNCDKFHLMNYSPLQKREPLFIITKSLNQFPIIKAQISDEIQPMEIYELSTVVFDDMLLSN